MSNKSANLACEDFVHQSLMCYYDSFPPCRMCVTLAHKASSCRLTYPPSPASPRGIWNREAVRSVALRCALQHCRCKQARRWRGCGHAVVVVVVAQGRTARGRRGCRGKAPRRALDAPPRQLTVNLSAGRSSPLAVEAEPAEPAYGQPGRPGRYVSSARPECRIHASARSLPGSRFAANLLLPQATLLKRTPWDAERLFTLFRTVLTRKNLLKECIALGALYTVRNILCTYYFFLQL